MPACVALSTNHEGIAFEWSNLGWSGQSSTLIHQQVEDALDFGLDPACATIPIFLPNGFASSPSKAAVDAMMFNHAKSVDLLERAGVEPISWTCIPFSSSLFDIGTADSSRRSVNASLAGSADRRTLVADFARLLTGERNSQG